MTDKCGSSECIDVIDKMGQRLSMSLMTSQNDGFKAIKELMEAHHNYLDGRIDEFKRAVEKDSYDLWPRLRASEANIKVIENILTPDLDSKIKKVVKGVLNSDEMESKIRKVSADNLDVRSMKSWRRTALEILAMIVGTVIAALILTHYTVSLDKPKQPIDSPRSSVELEKR